MLTLQASLKSKQDKRRLSVTGHQIAMAKQQIQMESELKESIKELEKTKSALKLQAARCRKLVAAYTKQLAEREAELRSSRELKDKQLSSVLRALIELEARLKREQKSIRAQLAEKDNIINNQQVEIESLKARIETAFVETRNHIRPSSMFVEEVEKNEPKMAMIEEEETILEDTVPESFVADRECYVKPDLISSLGIESDKRPKGDNSPTPSLRSAYHQHHHHHHHHHHQQRQVPYELTSCCPHDSLSSDTASTRSCLGDTSDSDFTAPSSSPQMKGILSVHNRSAFSPIYKGFQKQSSHEYPSMSKYNGSGPESSKNQAKCGIDETNKNVFFTCEESDKPEDLGSRSVKHLPSTLLQEVRIGNRTGDQDEYQDNPVLQCVNQILLKDQEDFLEEQMSLRLRGLDVGRMDADHSEHQGWMNGETDEVPPPEQPDDSKKCRRSPSPNMKAHILHQEKSCLTMNGRLTLARRPEQQDKAKSDFETKKSSSLTDLSKGAKFSAKHNPPLPPKPNRIPGMKRVEFSLDKRRDIKPTTVEFHNPPMVLPPPQPVCIDTTEIDIINKQPSLPLSILDPMDQGHDNELYVISNSALDDDIVQHLQGRSMNGSGLDIALGNAQRHVNDNLPHHTRTQHSNLPNGLLHPNHKTKNKGLVNNINLFSNGLFNHHLSPSKENNNGSSGLKRNRPVEGKSSSNFSTKTPPKTGMANTIKVASPVATLLTSGKAQESQMKDSSPSVSQIVRRFEDLGTKKADGSQDEEFTLDNCGQEDDSTDKESPSPNNGSVQQQPFDNAPLNGNPSQETANNVSYDNFLEATGLSQKSIMTPSRMLSNHKSVLKPKDVKHRNKVKAATAIVEKCNPTQVVGSTIKYWTEPYL